MGDKCEISPNCLDVVDWLTWLVVDVIDWNDDDNDIDDWDNDDPIPDTVVPVPDVVPVSCVKLLKLDGISIGCDAVILAAVVFIVEFDSEFEFVNDLIDSSSFCKERILASA